MPGCPGKRTHRWMNECNSSPVSATANAWWTYAASSRLAERPARSSRSGLRSWGQRPPRPASRSENDSTPHARRHREAGARAPPTSPNVGAKEAARGTEEEKSQDSHSGAEHDRRHHDSERREDELAAAAAQEHLDAVPGAVDADGTERPVVHRLQGTVPARQSEVVLSVHRHRCGEPVHPRVRRVRAHLWR